MEEALDLSSDRLLNNNNMSGTDWSVSKYNSSFFIVTSGAHVPTLVVVNLVASVNKRRHQLQRNAIILAETTNLLNVKNNKCLCLSLFSEIYVNL